MNITEAPRERQRLLLLQQDDAAPDSREAFEKEFPSHADGASLSEFKRLAHFQESDDGRLMEWYYDDLVLSIAAEDPFYMLERLQQKQDLPAGMLGLVMREEHGARPGTISRRVQLLAQDGRVLFEVRAGKDGRSLEIRGVDTCKVDGVLYGNGLLVKPNADNSITVLAEPYDS